MSSSDSMLHPASGEGRRRRFVGWEAAGGPRRERRRIGERISLSIARAWAPRPPARPASALGYPRPVRHRAVFFDLGGTLFSYRSINSHFDRVLKDMARGRGVEAPLDELRHAYRVAMGSTMASWTQRPFYLHRDLFTEAHVRYLRSLGVEANPEDADLRFSESRVLGEPDVAPRDDAAATLAA